MSQTQQIKEAIRQQFKRCVASPVYFLKKYSKVQHPVRGLVPFDLYKFQENTIQQFVDHEWNIILKSRQMGISTLCAGYILWMLNFNSNKTVLIIANTQDVAMNLIKKIKTMYDGLPNWLKEQIVTNNKQSLQFKNNSVVKAASATPNAGVSQALSLLVFDEAAVLNQTLAHQIWTAAMPTLSTGGDCIVGSSMVTIKHDETGIIENISMQQLYRRYPKQKIRGYIMNVNVKILTPSGWSKFQGVIDRGIQKVCTLITEKSSISGTPDHKIKLFDGKFIQICNLNRGDTLYGGDKVVQIIDYNESQKVYDAINVELNNQFYANKIAVSNCIVLSTPRGVGNTFHRLWSEAEQGNNRFNTIKLPWHLHPQRDQAWRDAQTKQLGQKQAARQCDCQFASSGDNVISNEVLQALDKECISDPIQKMHHDELWVWRFPQKSENYILSADVARGDGSDFSAFQILSIQKNEQVAEFKGKIPTTEFGQLIVRTAKMYSDALVIVENASIGWAVLQEIINLGYKNVYYHKKDYKYIDPELHSKIRQSKVLEKQRDIIGFTTSSRTRPLIIERMITIIENREFIIHSKRLLNQFWTFIWLNGKQQAMRSYNDDLVMALAIGIWVRNTAYIIRKEARAFAKSRLASIDSGLNLKHRQENKVSSGFFNSHNNLDKLNQGIIDIGSETIDLNDFYFSKRTRDE